LHFEFSISKKEVIMKKSLIAGLTAVAVIGFTGVSLAGPGGSSLDLQNGNSGNIANGAPAVSVGDVEVDVDVNTKVDVTKITNIDITKAIAIQNGRIAPVFPDLRSLNIGNDAEASNVSFVDGAAADAARGGAGGVGLGLFAVGGDGGRAAADAAAADRISVDQIAKADAGKVTNTMTFDFNLSNVAFAVGGDYKSVTVAAPVAP